MADIEEVVNTINTSQSHLHEAWFQSCKWGNETGVPGERDAPTKPLRLPHTMKIVHPLNLWGYRTWKGMRTQIGKSFSTIRTSPPLLTTRPGHERLEALCWPVLCLWVRDALAEGLPK